MSTQMKATLRVIVWMLFCGLVIFLIAFAIVKIAEPRSTTHTNIYQETVPESDFLIYEGSRFEVIAHSYGGGGYEAIYVDTRTNLVYLSKVTGGSGQSMSTILYNEQGQPMTREEFLASEADNRHLDK